MRNLFLFITILFTFQVSAQQVEPISKNVGKLNISVDPRMEALGIIQVLSDYPFVERSSSYTQNILEYFKDYVDSPAIKLTNKLYENGFSYDAPPAFMLYLEQPLSLKKQISYSDYLVHRAKGHDKLEEYRLAIQDFVNKVGFEEFWNSNSYFYKEMLQLTIDNMGEIDMVKALEEYYNENQNSYNIILCPSIKRHNYGPRIMNENNKYDIYSCNSLSHNKENIPYLTEDLILYLVWHEFSHSFVNPLSEKYKDLVMSYSHLFRLIEETMIKQAYNNWEICVNEHIVRAVVIRLLEKYKNKEEAEEWTRNELKNKFIYIKPLIEKLKEYESKKEAENITFSDFYPELLKAFQDLENLKDEAYIQFDGPIKNIFDKGKLAIIYPTAGTDTIGLFKLQEYVKKMSEFITTRLKPEELILVADSMALNTSLTDYNILLYGTFESNSFLSSLQSTLPFKIESGRLYADKEYIGSELKFITCFPNPHNPQRGMVLYTALNNESILDINNVQHGNEDYIIFLDRNNILHKGYYDKEGKWKF